MTTPNTGPDPEERSEPMPLPGHALPLEDWRQVVADAEAIAEENGGAYYDGADFAEEPYQPGEDGF